MIHSKNGKSKVQKLKLEGYVKIGNRTTGPYSLYTASIQYETLTSSQKGMPRAIFGSALRNVNFV